MPLVRLGVNGRGPKENCLIIENVGAMTLTDCEHIHEIFSVVVEFQGLNHIKGKGHVIRSCLLNTGGACFECALKNNALE